MHGQIGAPFQHRCFEFLDEQPFAADLRQRPVENPVAARTHAENIDCRFRIQRPQPVADMLRLPHRQARFARGDHQTRRRRSLTPVAGLFFHRIHRIHRIRHIHRTQHTHVSAAPVFPHTCFSLLPMTIHTCLRAAILTARQRLQAQPARRPERSAKVQSGMILTLGQDDAPAPLALLMDGYALYASPEPTTDIPCLAGVPEIFPPKDFRPRTSRPPKRAAAH